MTALHTYSYIVGDTQRGCHTLKFVNYVTGASHLHAAAVGYTFLTDLTKAIPFCDIISTYIFTSHTTTIKLAILSATT